MAFSCALSGRDWLTLLSGGGQSMPASSTSLANAWHTALLPSAESACQSITGMLSATKARHTVQAV